MKFRQDIQRSLINETNFRRAIEESMPVGLRVHELDGSISYVNPAFSKLVGWGSEDLQGLKPPFPFWAKEDEELNSMKLQHRLILSYIYLLSQKKAHSKVR
jgi:PAS domain S-box-containing protein